mmetsp:Transcript_22063/g.68997  ORF Transcript_22063/g.68997 Transcript_22063/m.68997 type:complete len:418 (+) Transcript_22063:1050-2303(+)
MASRTGAMSSASWQAGRARTSPWTASLGDTSSEPASTASVIARAPRSHTYASSPSPRWKQRPWRRPSSADSATRVPSCSRGRPRPSPARRNATSALRARPRPSGASSSRPNPESSELSSTSARPPCARATTIAFFTSSDTIASFGSTPRRFVLPSTPRPSPRASPRRHISGLRCSPRRNNLTGCSKWPTASRGRNTPASTSTTTGRRTSPTPKSCKHESGARPCRTMTFRGSSLAQSRTGRCWIVSHTASWGDWLWPTTCWRSRLRLSDSAELIAPWSKPSPTCARMTTPATSASCRTSTAPPPTTLYAQLEIVARARSDRRRARLSRAFFVAPSLRRPSSWLRWKRAFRFKIGNATATSPKTRLESFSCMPTFTVSIGESDRRLETKRVVWRTRLTSIVNLCVATTTAYILTSNGS